MDISNDTWEHGWFLAGRAINSYHRSLQLSNITFEEATKGLDIRTLTDRIYKVWAAVDPQQIDILTLQAIRENLEDYLFSI